MAKIVIIRIRGMIGVRRQIRETLDMLRLRKKFSCVVIEESKENNGMLRKVQTHVSYGKIDGETLKLLIIKRGRKKGNKPVELAGKQLEAINEFLENKKKLQDLEIKPFFRLHPPKGGFKKSTKLLYPKGLLGNNPQINDLVKRML